MATEFENRWLLLIHQIPPKPDYLRVKIWRRLQRIGSVPVKNSVYILPKTDQAQEDFQWILREVVQSGGDASLCEARFVEGLSDDEVEELFRAARDVDYRGIAAEAERLAKSLAKKRKSPDADKRQLPLELEKLHKRMDEVVAIDFFGGSAREVAERILFALDAHLRGSKLDGKSVSAGVELDGLRQRVWVTRKGIHVDRMGSAWLIRRFIDPAARFKFVTAKGYRPEPGEIRFDMFEAEFTHEGDRCTFEVLLDRTGLKDSALRPIAEIIHDIDLKDEKFGRDETGGIERLILGIAMRHKDDGGRLERASAMFDDLYEYFRRKQD
jgi:hypothetical protein